MKKMKKCNRTRIGGQAVMEGVMMRGRTSMATAIRNPDGEIVVQALRVTPSSDTLSKIPIVRGVVSFFTSLIAGTKTLLNSAEVYGDIEAEPTGFEKWLSQKTKIDVMDIAIWIGLILGLALSVGLFFVLPTFLAQVIDRYLLPKVDLAGAYPVWYNLMEGIVRILIFVGYILAVSLMKDIRRVLMYHGAEHKTISCFEYGLDMTVENAQKMTTVHDRCGTTFIFLIMIISILLFSIVGAVFNSVGWNVLQTNVFARVGVRLLLLPLVAGISYEFLRLFSKSDNIVFRILKAPGLLLQKLTTRQPTDDMVEVAVTAFQKVLEMEADPSVPEQPHFARSFRSWYATQFSAFKDKNIDKADLDWLICHVMGCRRSEMSDIKLLDFERQTEIEALIQRRFDGEPVQYIIGTADFYGYEIEVCPDVLIPRMDTECVVEKSISIISAERLVKVLDMCTGSGAIAVTIAAKCPDTEVTAADISEKALSVARKNAEKNNTRITFIESDMFASVDTYDMIVCNPPYVSASEMQQLSPEVRREPETALYGGEDGLDFYRRIARDYSAHLNANGVLVLEIGSTQSEAVQGLFENVTFESIRDLEGRDRGLVVRRAQISPDKVPMSILIPADPDGIINATEN